MLTLVMMAAVAAAYGPPPPVNNPFIPSSCGSEGGCPGSGSCGSGCQSSHAQVATTQTPPCSGNDRCDGECRCSRPEPSPSSTGKYWWEGENNPFRLPANHHTQCPGGTCPPPQPGTPHQQSPAATHHQPQPPTTHNVLVPPMGICPAGFVCVQWQLCREGYVITDGTGVINKLLKDIPPQVAASYTSCGGDMLCCGVPSILPTSGQHQQSPPNPQPPHSKGILPLPAPTSNSQPPIGTKNNPETIPLPQPQPGTSPQTTQSGIVVGPTQKPSYPQGSTSFQSPGETDRVPIPGPRPQPTSFSQDKPDTPGQVPTQPAQQARPVTPDQANVQLPVSSPIGLVSPASRRPIPMMGGMGMMGMAMRSGSCSAGTYCVQQSQCNPYTGFIIRDNTQLMAVWPDAPTVPLLPCLVLDLSITNGVCCQESHPNAGGFD
ncbi:uncharacterized protein [Panulirus ornatus]|uniref:uncharacterized protein n=1 Tax=Panulirus ornatus TaxID=150431 RepID=UPI003A849BAD